MGGNAGNGGGDARNRGRNAGNLGGNAGDIIEIGKTKWKFIKYNSLLYLRLKKQN